MFYCLKKIKTNIWRYHYFTPVYQKSWWYDLQFLRYRAWQTEIGNFGSFLPFYLPKKPTIQNFEMKELARDIILHMCTKNHNHMRYSFWDTESEGQIFFVILGHCFFLLPAPPPPPPTQQPRKSKLWKNEKASGDVIILHMCTKNHNHMMYVFWDMECNRLQNDNVLSFWVIFDLLLH